MRHSTTLWDNSACIHNIPDASRFHSGMAEVGSVPGVYHYLPSQRDHSLDSPQSESIEELDSEIETDPSDGDTEEGDSGSAEAYRAFPEIDQSLGVGPMEQGPDASELSRWEAGNIPPGCRPTLKDFVQVPD